MTLSLYERGRVVGETVMGAANLLQALCERVDDAEDLDRALIEAFSATRIGLAEGVNAAKALNSECDARVLQINEHIERLVAYRDTVKKVQASLKDRLKEAMIESGWTSLSDLLGRKVVSLVQNSISALKLDFEVRAKTVPYVLDSRAIEAISPKYVKTVSYLVLDTEAVRSALEAGETLHWAWLEKGSHVRINK